MSGTWFCPACGELVFKAISYHDTPSMVQLVPCDCIVSEKAFYWMLGDIPPVKKQELL